MKTYWIEKISDRFSFIWKFLLFYEAFAKTFGEQPDFSHLRGYKKGPVFSNVWGDYTKERASFDVAENGLKLLNSLIN